MNEVFPEAHGRCGLLVAIGAFIAARPGRAARWWVLRYTGTAGTAARRAGLRAAVRASPDPGRINLLVARVILAGTITARRDRTRRAGAGSIGASLSWPLVFQRAGGAGAEGGNHHPQRGCEKGHRSATVGGGGVAGDRFHRPYEFCNPQVASQSCGGRGAPNAPDTVFWRTMGGAANLQRLSPRQLSTRG